MRIFNETQRFDQWWIRLINTGLLVFLSFCAYKWYIANEAIGNVGSTNIIGQSVMGVSIIPILLLFHIMRLRTQIDERGVHYQFFPFNLSYRTILWNEMEKCYIKTYNPLKEYGGWGYRSSMGKKGSAINIKGNQGIQIAFKSGKRLLIGTQKETDALKVIRRHFKAVDE
ncbi:hypothetical protein [Maribacter sp. 2304DJ31-5]|uniref:hypothetical protein n=1 Tax=Maribacter sp. 2304DJ31-5 TaxID=3386273 RepID=UPI0039BD4D7C